ncbi:unnamed protein product [Mytilus edulis]|uniref:Endonuclease/exonuclease/phosphatase domain-containing protein n=1 Tax=Mytilus edulis TaxID=6550 RepID=A0A8S3UQB5_MYTED|nr:unnamed protein product [Mytilus edulis]
MSTWIYTTASEYIPCHDNTNLNSIQTTSQEQNVVPTQIGSKTQELFLYHAETHQYPPDRILLNLENHSLTIATCTIEGVKSNSKYLNDHVKVNIICLQEHWLYKFQQPDSVDDISSINLPICKGGVSISWPTNISHLVEKLNDGNERLVAIEMNTETKLCIICTYFSSHNPSVHSIDEYSNCLDILFNIIFKFSDTHKIVIAGDFNVTLLASRSYNKHDEQFKKFFLDLQLNSTTGKQCALFHSNGYSQS